MSTINLKDIQQKLYEKIIPSGWGPRLKDFILSEDFHKILQQLFDESTNGKRFTPVLKQLFRAFEECPYKELKVVIIGQDPYPKAEIADGLAFSSSNTMKTPASLRYILKEIEDTVYPDGYKYDPDLTRWSKQGILLLNTALTTTVGQTATHIELWKPFIIYLLEQLGEYDSGLVYVFMGNRAKEWRVNVPVNNFRFFTTHPAKAAYNGDESWDSGNAFNQIAKIVKQHYNYDIKW